MKKEKIINEEAPKEQYLVVPMSWFSRLLEISKQAVGDEKYGKQYLLGYISSADSILKYARRVDEK